MAESKTSPPGGTTLIIISLVFAVVSVIAVNLYVQSVRSSVNEASFEVYVLTKTLYPGDHLTSKDLREIRVPNSFRESFDSLNFVDQKGKDEILASRDAIRRTANQGEILLNSVFAGRSADDILPIITPGKRIVSMPINANMVPGLLRPGVWVDIEAPFSTGGAFPTVLPVMERVQIKAVGLRTLADENDQDVRPGTTNNRSMGSFHTITIEVSPDEATELDMIKRVAVGDFELHIRNPEDQGTPKIKDGGINPDVLDLINTKHKVLIPVKPS